MNIVPQRTVVSAVSMLLCAGVVGARAHEPAEARRLLSVSGVGEVRVPADLAVVAFGVHTTAKTAAAAAKENASRTAAVVKTLRRMLPTSAGVETLRYRLEPEYERPASQTSRRGPPRIVGYRAANEVEVRSEDLSGLGKLIDAAIAAGANRVASLRFTLRDEAPSRRDAIRAAGESARRMAEVLADSLGVSLGPLRRASVRPEHLYPPRPLEFGRGLAAKTAPTSVEPGEVTVRATVEATYEIR